MQTQTRAVLRYHGGKFRLAPWIISNFPPHKIYAEPYCGAASILFQKPRCYSEVISDLDGEIVNFFRVLRDPATAKDLKTVLEMTPYARQEFLDAYRPASDDTAGCASSLVESARRLVIRSFMGFGSGACNSDHDTGFRSNSNRSGTTPAHDWMHYPEHVMAFCDRLRGVVIENRPALQIIGQHQSSETLFYVDPPYLHSTRTRGNPHCKKGNYRYEMTDDNHRELAAALHAAAGMVVLSGYPSDLYDRELFSDWHRVERATHADGARERTEVLWLNAAAAASVQAGLFTYGGEV